MLQIYGKLHQKLIGIRTEHNVFLIRLMHKARDINILKKEKRKENTVETSKNQSLIIQISHTPNFKGIGYFYPLWLCKKMTHISKSFLFNSLNSLLIPVYYHPKRHYKSTTCKSPKQQAMLITALGGS